MTQRRALVTGASGFVGRYVIPALLSHGYEVHGIGRACPGNLPVGMKFHVADLLDAQATAEVVKRVEATDLLHLAWYVTPGLFWRAPENLDWMAASLSLYRAFAAAGGRRLVGVGSCAEYDWTYALLDEADTPCRPATLYGMAKHALHQVLAAAAAQDGIRLAWARLFFLYGPYEAPSRLVPDVALSLLRGDPALCGDGTAQRDFMHVEDVAGALVAVLASDHIGPVNIASGECRPLRDVIATVAAELGRPDLIRLGARPPSVGEPARLAAANYVLSQAVGFTPAWPLAVGIRQTANWWRAAGTLSKPTDACVSQPPRQAL